MNVVKTVFNVHNLWLLRIVPAQPFCVFVCQLIVSEVNLLLMCMWLCLVM